MGAILISSLIAMDTIGPGGRLADVFQVWALLKRLNCRLYPEFKSSAVLIERLTPQHFQQEMLSAHLGSAPVMVSLYLRRVRYAFSISYAQANRNLASAGAPSTSRRALVKCDALSGSRIRNKQAIIR